MNASLSRPWRAHALLRVTLVWVAIGIVPWSARCVHAGPINRPPNIVVLLADDMGYGDPGCFNQGSKALTPHMDRLARAGRRFTDAHSASSVCSPSRYALLTGRYAWRSRLKLGVLNPWDPALIEPGRLTLPALLKRHGYVTAAFGKWHLGWTWATVDGKPLSPDGSDFSARVDFSRPIADGPNSRGFDLFFGMVGNTVASPCLLENNQPIFTGVNPPLKSPPKSAACPGPSLPLGRAKQPAAAY